MAKVYFGKLDLNRDNSVKTFNWNGQAIEVKQYLPVEEKLDLITKILSETDDGGRFFNPSRLKVFYTINLFFAYTNVSITDKQAEDNGKVFDMLVSSGLYKEFLDNMNKEEISFIEGRMNKTIDKIEWYNNSIYGILDNINADYGNLQEGAQKLLKDLSESKDIELVSDIMTKLG